ncbi:hypothetical protein, unknown function [Leishmania infantum JPCM5]|uniref:Uncharacterized protein n=2 Tax=Leishmania infantum TaxID=5671 RepID=E9AGD8_LEIIN|nr:hypothetical protein, unknown function [Leishmania infantum JPCM5]CBZ08438.1 hypothetical protein, unknown function [Leishmania infantum JPCM5]|eukprot:XP_003392290.1 hypothetical protein, unknown function [Leishmania infantum JPCM5]
MSSNPSSSPPPRVHSPQRLPQGIYGGAARALAVAACPLWTRGVAGDAGVPASAHSGYETNHSRSELAQAHQRHAYALPSPIKADPSTTRPPTPPQKPQRSLADLLVTVPTAAVTKSVSDGPHATDHARPSTRARQQPQHLTQLSASTADEGSATAAAPPLWSVLPPWAQLDFAAFDGRKFSVDTAPISGGGEGGPPWELITAQNRITKPQPIQAERTRDSKARSYLRVQRQVPHEQQSSSPQVRTAAGGVSIIADASSFASSPLFEWVPYDGWDDSDLCQGKGGGYYRRDASGRQYRVTHRLRPGDLSGPLAAMESGATTPGQTQGPDDVGGAAMPVTVNANPAVPSPQRTGEATCADLDAPQRGLQQQHRHKRRAAAPAANASPLAFRDTVTTDKPRSVRRDNHAEENRGEDNGGGSGGGGAGDAVGLGHEGFTTTMVTPPPLLSSAAVAQGTSALRHFQFQHAIAAAAPSSLGFPGAGAAAAAHRTSSGVVGSFFLPLEAVIRKALPVSRGGFSSRACSVYTGVRSDGTLSIIMLEEYPGYTESTPAQPPRATASSPAFLATTAEGTPTVTGAREGHHSTKSPAPPTRQDWTWLPPKASAEQPVLLPSADTDASRQLLATVPQSAAAGVAGATSSTNPHRQGPIGTGGVVNEGAAIRDACAGLTSGSPPRAPPTPMPPPPPESGDSPYAASRDRVDLTRLGVATATVNAAAVAASPMIALRGQSGSSVPPGGGRVFQRHWLPLGLCALPVAARGDNGALAPVSSSGTPAVADVASRAAATMGAVMPESTEQTHLAGCDEGARRGPVPAVARTVWTTRVTDAAATGRKPLPAPARVIPSLTLFNPTELPSKGTTSASLSAPQSAESGCGGRGRQRTKSLLPAWCHVVAEALLSPLSPPKMHRPGQRRRTSTSGTTTAVTTTSNTVARDIHSRRWSAEARGGMPVGSTAKFVTAAERALAPQCAAVAASAVDDRRREGGAEEQESCATPTSHYSHLPPRESAGPDVSVFGNTNPTGRQIPPPAPLKTTKPTPPSLVPYSSEPDGVGGGRGIVRVVAETTTVDFDAHDAPHAYAQVLMEVDTKHATTTSTVLGSGDAGVAANADAAAVAAPTLERAHTRKVQLSTSTTLCRFQGYHQRRRDGGDAVANPGVDDCGAGVGAPVAPVPTTTAASAKNNTDDTSWLNYGGSRVGDPSASPTRFRAVGATWEKQGGHASTIARSIGTAVVSLHSDAARPHTRTCRPPVLASASAVTQLTMLAPDGTEMVVQEHANERPSQRRHVQVGCCAGTTAASSGYAARKNSPYIMGGCANTGYLRFGDVATASPSAAVTTASGMLAKPAAAMRHSVIMRSPAVPAGLAGESEGGGDGGDVDHSSEGLVNTSQNTRFKGADGLGSLSIYAETVPLFQMLPAPIEGVPMSSSSLASPLQNRPEQQQPQGVSNVAKVSSVSRVPRRPLAQHLPKLGHPAGHTAECDV